MKRENASYLEGIISIIVNTGLFALKLWAGIVSGSIALTADAWHTLSDSISSIVVIFGTKLSSRKPDKKHPFGHGRWEQIASVFIGFLLALIAYDFLKSSITQFQAKETAQFGTLAIVITIISIVVKEALAQYAFYIGKKTDNLSVKADGWHHRTDALSSLVVLIGIFFTDKFWWIDSVLGIIIAVMLFFAAYHIIKDAIDKILGEVPTESLKTKIKDLIKSQYELDLFPHHFHIHNYISSQELTFHIKVNNAMNVVSAHTIATNIEKKIFEDLHISATIHIEPHNFEHEQD